VTTDYVDPRRTLLVNDPTGLRAANEKLFTLRFPALIPDTLVSADMRELTAAVTRWGRAVLKPTDAMGGRGVLLLRPDDPNLRSALEISTNRWRRQVIIQQWVTAAADGDRRVIVIDGEPAGVIRRVAADGHSAATWLPAPTSSPTASAHGTRKSAPSCDLNCPGWASCWPAST